MSEELLLLILEITKLKGDFYFDSVVITNHRRNKTIKIL